MKKIYISILFIISVSFVVNAQWNTVAPMNSMRSEHVSANLLNGSVLVAGGWHSPTNLTTAEIYNPLIDVWTNTSTQMNSPHTWGEAVTLANGKVLVIGGYSGSVNTTACDLYDPSSDTWTVTGSLTTGRSWFTATLLNNGKVLVAGGYNPSVGYQVGTGELYDPATGTWSSGGTLGVARSYHSAVLLNDGSVLVAGGLGTVGTLNQLTSAELYNPSTNLWTPASDMNVLRDFFGMSKLSDGTVMAAGGRSFISGSNYVGLTEVEIYDPVANVWTLTTPLPARMCYNNLVTLNDGRVLSIAGLDSIHTANPIVTVKSSTYISNATGTSWTSAFANNDGRFEFSSILMSDGRVLLSGGINDNSVELYGAGTGVPQLNNTQSVIIYPNPAKNQFTVYGLASAVDAKLELFNMLGENVYETQLLTTNSKLSTTADPSSGRQTVEVPSLKAGIYFVKIQSTNQEIVQKLTITN